MRVFIKDTGTHSWSPTPTVYMLEKGKWMTGLTLRRTVCHQSLHAVMGLSLWRTSLCQDWASSWPKDNPEASKLKHQQLKRDSGQTDFSYWAPSQSWLVKLSPPSMWEDWLLFTSRQMLPVKFCPCLWPAYLEIAHGPTPLAHAFVTELEACFLCFLNE